MPTVMGGVKILKNVNFTCFTFITYISNVQCISLWILVGSFRQPQYNTWSQHVTKNPRWRPRWPPDITNIVYVLTIS